MGNKGETVFQEVDVLFLIAKIGRKSKATQAKILQELEKVVPDPEDFQEIRKIVLDEINSLTRAFVNEIFGDIEFLVR